MNAATALLALLACTSTPDAPPGRADTLVIAVATEPSDFLSVLQGALVEQAILNNLSYTAFDEDFTCRLEYRPRLVKRWSWSPDHTTLDMELRDDLRWQDGQPVTASDVAFTYELVADPTVASPLVDAVRRMRPDARPRVVSPTRLEWKFTAAFDEDTMLSQASSIPALPRHLLEKADRASLRTHALNTSLPMSSGPWKLAPRNRRGELVLEPNEAFSGPPEESPRLNRVIFKVIPDHDARIAALRAGDVDLVDRLTVADADVLASSNPEFQLHRRGWRNLDYVAWNLVDPSDPRAPSRLFADREVRRALAAAIDTDRLLRELLTSPVTGEVYGRPAIGTIPPALCGIHNDTIRRIPVDRPAARAALEALGWADTNGDGWLDKDGEPFRFTMISNADSALRGRTAQLLEADLALVGVDVEIEELSGGAFVERLKARDFDAALAGWSAALFADPSQVWATGAAFNLSGWSSPEADALIARGAAQSDPAVAREAWLELQRLIYEDQPHMFLYWSDEIVALHNRFHDAVIDVIAPWRKLHQWHVPPEKVKYREP